MEVHGLVIELLLQSENLGKENFYFHPPSKEWYTRSQPKCTFDNHHHVLPIGSHHTQNR